MSTQSLYAFALKRSRGFSIVELMVAMALSLLLLAGVIAIFSSSRASYETTDKISRIQENGRYALDQLAGDVRSAGYVGCSRSPTNLSTSLNNATSLEWNFLAGPTRGYQYTSSGTWTPTLDASISALTPVDNSDILVLRVPRRDAAPARLQSAMSSSTATITVANVANSFKRGDVAVIYSCEARAYFQVTGYAAGVIQHVADNTLTPGNANGDLSYPHFGTNAEVLPIETVVYYIDTSTAGSGTPTSLWRRRGSDTPEELVEGVERMEIAYGRDTNLDDSVDDYVTANAVTDWTRVLAVRVALLVRSLEEYGPDVDTETYTLLAGSNPVTVPAPNDRRMREVFTVTASVRNRTVIF